MKEKSWKQIQSSHERRMWVTQVILPLVGWGVVLMTNDNAREAVVDTVKVIKNRTEEKLNDLKKKFKKTEEIEKVEM